MITMKYKDNKSIIKTKENDIKSVTSDDNTNDYKEDTVEKKDEIKED